MRQWTMILVIAVMILAFLALTLSGPSDAHSGSGYSSAKAAIYKHFPSAYRGEAMAVVKCETGGTYNYRAVSRNGLYYGLFQQGAWHRQTYGFAWDSYTQARAGWRGFKANGYCWTCGNQWPTCGRGLDG